MDGIEKLIERVGNLELWQWWLKGAWAALTWRHGFIYGGPLQAIAALSP